MAGALRLLDFPPPADRAAASPDTVLERLRRLAKRPADGPQLALPRCSATDRLLDRLWNALLRRAEPGPVAGAQALAEELAGLGPDLEVAGLGLLARQIRAPANPDSILAAAFAFEACRRSRAGLAWMS